jgi:hypothetical protein
MISFIAGAWAAVCMIILCFLYACFEVRDRAGDEDVDDQLSMIEAMERTQAKLTEIACDNSAWMKAALQKLEAMPEGFEGTGEDVRTCLVAMGIEAPRHPNVWGALLNVAGRKGLLAKTGELRPMKRADGSRSTPVYRKVARVAEAAE